jgi:hypothetical protein
MSALGLLLCALAATEEVPVDDAPQGYTPPDEAAHETLRLTGYVDVGFAKATGDGTSFAPNDNRIPSDYFADPFATAVNSRGDVASTDSSGHFTNGFLPRSVGLGSKPGFLLNTASVDVRFTPKSFPLFVFTRLQAMPRFVPGADATRFELQQAFARLTPFASQEFAVSLGRSDSVFGIEYLENEANFRLNITPSLIARYTTGQSLGLKVFYRYELPAAWSAISINAAASNGGTRVEALVPVDASLVGVPVGSARLGYELNRQKVQLKAGLSGLYGARNDQRSPNALQRAAGVDLRVTAFGVSFAGELLRLVDDHGPIAGKYTGQAVGDLASAFDVWGGWARLAWSLPWKGGALSSLTPYVRYDRRHGHFEGAPVLVTDRFTFGARVELFESVALKAEYVVNRELSGAASVNNNVLTSSAVFTW